MPFLDTIQDHIKGFLIGGNSIELKLQRSQAVTEQALMIAEEAQEEAAAAKLVKETLVDLELGIEDVGWREITQGGVWNFSRTGLRKMISLARLMFLANPLIKRAVTVQELYVFGAGCTTESDNPDVAEVLKDFNEDEQNQSVIGAAWPEREREQRIEGNTFLTLFTNPSTGACRIRVLPTDYVFDILHNPQDSREPWFYRRTMMLQMSPDSGVVGYSGDILYPDIAYNPRVKPYNYDGHEIDWSIRVLHVKSGGLSIMKFGMPELFSAFNWATAYKRILENFATILAAYARVAMRITKNAGKKGVAATKKQMETGVSGSGNQAIDNNPPTNTASWFVSSGATEISAVKTAHSTTGPDEARALRSMVAAGTDTPEHFFGDSDVGNFATSETLDRPTELKMIARQSMWTGVMTRIDNFVITASARAPMGKLKQAGYRVEEVYDPFDKAIRYKITPPAGKKITFEIKFPSITERSIVDRVRAVVQAVTLNGSTAEGIIPDRSFVFKLLMEAMGQKKATELMLKYYPEPVLQGFADPGKTQQDSHLKAEGSKELGDAALIAANAKKSAGGPNVSTPNAND